MEYFEIKKQYKKKYVMNKGKNMGDLNMTSACKTTGQCQPGLLHDAAIRTEAGVTWPSRAVGATKSLLGPSGSPCPLQG